MFILRNSRKIEEEENEQENLTLLLFLIIKMSSTQLKDLKNESSKPQINLVPHWKVNFKFKMILFTAKINPLILILRFIQPSIKYA